MKVGASVACARRGGCSATFDELNKYFTISNVPVAPSQYWNSIHGREKGEAVWDEEGKQTMRVLARKHELSGEEHRTWQGAIWPSGKGRTGFYSFYPVKRASL